jgi:hypothetical protein
MTRTSGVKSLPQAYEVIKEIDFSADWESDYRTAVRQALVAIPGDGMNDRTHRYLA